MTKEEKELLLKDLSARLPYGTFVQFEVDGHKAIKALTVDFLSCTWYHTELIKPYLRPMSSMTKAEREEENKLWDIITKTRNDLHYLYTDFLLSHHLDYRGLIPMGLALEAPEDMYKI